MNVIENLGRRFPVATYCLLTFSFTWGLRYWYSLLTADGSLPSFNIGLVGRIGPSVAGFILIVVTMGRQGLRRIGRSMLDTSAGTGWIIFAAFFEFVFFSGIMIALWISGLESPVAARPDALPSIITFLTTLFSGLFLWGLPEEIGWRGWLLPKLQDRFSPLSASLVLSVVATLWHLQPVSLPAIAAPGQGLYLPGHLPEAVERLMITIPFTLVITWLYNRTNGSLLLMMLSHSGSNTAYFWLDDVFGGVRTDLFRSGFLCGLVVVAAVFTPLVARQKGNAVTGRTFFTNV